VHASNHDVDRSARGKVFEKSTELVKSEVDAELFVEEKLKSETLQ
jgi:hypothetical protein